MWRTWASPDEAQSNTSENDWGEVYSSLLQNTHTLVQAHLHTHYLIQSSAYPKNTPDVLWWVIEWKGLHRKVWRLSDLILDACCLRLFIYLPSPFTHWLSFFSGPLTVIWVIFFLVFGIHFSCSHIFLRLSSLPHFMTCWQIHNMALVNAICFQWQELGKCNSRRNL